MPLNADGVSCPDCNSTDTEAIAELLDTLEGESEVSYRCGDCGAIFTDADL